MAPKEIEDLRVSLDYLELKEDRDHQDFQERLEKKVSPDHQAETASQVYQDLKGQRETEHPQDHQASQVSVDKKETPDCLDRLDHRDSKDPKDSTEDQGYPVTKETRVYLGNEDSQGTLGYLGCRVFKGRKEWWGSKETPDRLDSTEYPDHRVDSVTKEIAVSTVNLDSKDLWACPDFLDETVKAAELTEGL